MTARDHRADARSHAPLYVDTFAFCEWLLGHLDERPGALARAICDRALVLHEAVLLALRNRRREHELKRADEVLMVMRSELRLAAATGALAEEQVVHALERADAIGRQVGGFLRSLGQL